MEPVKLSYILCKPEAGTTVHIPPIILYHSLLRSKEQWSLIQQPLADKTQRMVYAVDARNHGTSERSDAFNFQLVTDDLEHFMETKAISKAILIGNSMGGLAIMTLALRAPEKVEKLIVEGVSPRDLNPKLCSAAKETLLKMKTFFEDSLPSDDEETLQQKAAEIMFQYVPMISSDYEIIHKIKFPMEKTDNGYKLLLNLEAIVKCFENPPICEYPKDKTYDGPVLFIYGDKSNIVNSEDKGLILKTFPKVHFSCFENTGHFVSVRYPEKFTDEIVKFLQN